MRKPNKLTNEEEIIITNIINSYMYSMVEELNTVNIKNTFTGFEEIGKLVLSGVALALQEGNNVEIKLDITPEKDKNIYFNGIPISLN